MSEGDKMIIEDKAARLEAFEKMLDFVRKNYEDSLSKMEELKANTVDASAEKHVPAVTVEGELVKVQVGSAVHPMLEEHHIEWIYLELENGGFRKDLVPGEAPEAAFHTGGAKPVAVYAYCNLHGLWKTEL